MKYTLRIGACLAAAAVLVSIGPSVGAQNSAKQLGTINFPSSAKPSQFGSASDALAGPPTV